MSMERSFGRYILEERIAMGGMAEIFRARTTTAGFEKKVCIKRLLPHFAESPDFVTMFRDEARIAAQLQHANIVQVFDFGEVDESLFLAMEFIQGADLRCMLERSQLLGTPPTVGQSLQIIIEICRGLHYAHNLKHNKAELGLVHRDISPHNILVSPLGEVKIIDFGIAKAGMRSTHTSTGVVKGKLSYMSPEQAEGKPVDHRTDQFATSVLLWEMLTGARLFHGDSDAVTLRMVLECEPASPRIHRPNLDERIERVVMRGLSRNPDERFPNMRAMENALNRIALSLYEDPDELNIRLWSEDMYREVSGPRKTAVLENYQESLITKTAPEKSSRERSDSTISYSGETRDGVSHVFTRSRSQETHAKDVDKDEKKTLTYSPANPPVTFPVKEDPELEVPTDRVPRTSTNAPVGLNESTAASLSLKESSSVSLSRAMMAVGAIFILFLGVRLVVQSGDEPRPSEEKLMESAQPTTAAESPSVAPDTLSANGQGTEPVKVPADPKLSEVESSSKAVALRKAKTPKPLKKKSSAKRPVTAAGKLQVNVRGTWANVYLGKRKLGETPGTFSLPVGTHRIRLVNPETGLQKNATVKISTKATTRLVETLGPE